MKVIVVGSGGREHALAVALSRTAQVSVAPGNAATPGSVDLDPEAITPDMADLVVIGPEAPLVAGLADRLRARGTRVLGPGGEGARLEGSKAWMKELFAEIGLPTAASASFTDPDAALAFAAGLERGAVIKTDGLAGGKGVLMPGSMEAAEEQIRSCLSGEAFGRAGQKVVIEERLEGPELSVFALCDGRRVVPFGSARDHKRLGDGDTGPNTGGMGAFSPVPGADEQMLDRIFDEVIEPTVWGLRKRDIDYRGFLFCGLMLTEEGPKVLEYNVRFGDPEAQVVMPLVTADLADLLAGAADGSVGDTPALSTQCAVSVVCAAEGYPASPRTGDPISGLDSAEAADGVSVFAAGVEQGPDGGLVTAGGRVLSVTATGPDLETARHRAYGGVTEISFAGMHYRSDIAAPQHEGEGS